MAPSRLGLSPDLFVTAFPFHVAFDRDMRIVQAGEVVRRLCPNLSPQSSLHERFEISRPHIQFTFEAIREQSQSLFILQSLDTRLLLKGQMLADDRRGVMFFLCSPWLTELAAAGALDLSLGDFAIHDPVADFLFLLQSKDSALSDLNRLAMKLQEQRAKLQQAHGELEARVQEQAAAEEALRALNDSLEARVSERTRELIAANEGLRGEIDERKKAEETIKHLAYHDALTGLPNRTLLKEHLSMGLVQARENSHMLAVMFLDLDRFKVVNDTAGHAEGDALLIAVAAQLRDLVRPGDTVGRVGGDEFVLVLPEIAQVEEAVAVARRIVESLGRPQTLAGHEFHITPSIGITVYPTDGDNPEALLTNADIAMYHAKEQGRDNYQFYTPDLNVRILERLALENDLRRGLEREEFEVYYQPQVNISTGQIVGMEALVRWQHLERGLVMPAEFIPAADETGLIVPLGEWVLRTACAQAQAWQDAGLSPLRLAVNLSPRQFQERDLVERVAQVLQETGLDPHSLQLEITESVAIQDVDHTTRALRRLKEMGVQIAIDDFGTGHSALSYLGRFPIDMVKIDQSFIRDIAINPSDAEITNTVIVMAHNLQLEVIAEGVETEEQLAFLRQRSCDEMQGFLFSRPVSAPEFEALLAQRKRSEAA